MSKLMMLVSTLMVIFAVGCGEPSEEWQIESADVKVIYCKDFDLSERGFHITRHETKKKYPLYRGGFNFRSIKGVKVLNSNCSFKSTNK